MKIIITESQFKMLKENREKFDSLFNKIADEGWDSLTPQEQDYVKRFSEWSTTGKKGSFEDTDEVEPTNYEESNGEEFKTTLIDGTEFTFIFDYADILKSENIFYGTVLWSSEEWVGLIVTNKNGNLMEIDFIMDQDFQSYDSNDVDAGYDETQEVRLVNELDKKDVHKIKYFFEEEVIPHLM